MKYKIKKNKNLNTNFHIKRLCFIYLYLKNNNIRMILRNDSQGKYIKLRLKL
jgi:hypothetical protein